MVDMLVDIIMIIKSIKIQRSIQLTHMRIITICNQLKLPIIQIKLLKQQLINLLIMLIMMVAWKMIAHLWMLHGIHLDWMLMKMVIINH